MGCLMKVIAVQANVFETAELAKKFSHDEFARVIGVESPSNADIAEYLMARLRGMTLTVDDVAGPPRAQRVHECVYVVPVISDVEDAGVIEARLMVMPQAPHELPTHLFVSESMPVMYRVLRANAHLVREAADES